MSWGSAQEGATLYGLMHALPKSKLLEAGLFRVDGAQLPNAWCFKKGELPPLGASPDGMLFHPEGLCQRSDIAGPISAPEARLCYDLQAFVILVCQARCYTQLSEQMTLLKTRASSTCLQFQMIANFSSDFQWWWNCMLDPLWRHSWHIFYLS